MFYKLFTIVAVAVATATPVHPESETILVPEGRIVCDSAQALAKGPYIRHWFSVPPGCQPILNATRARVMQYQNERMDDFWFTIIKIQWRTITPRGLQMYREGYMLNILPVQVSAEL